MIHRQLTKTQKEALSICHDMTMKREVITDNSFGLLWAEKRGLSKEWARKTGGRMLGILVVKGKLKAHWDDDFFLKTYKLSTLPRNIFPLTRD